MDHFESRPLENSQCLSWSGWIFEGAINLRYGPGPIFLALIGWNLTGRLRSQLASKWKVRVASGWSVFWKWVGESLLIRNSTIRKARKAIRTTAATMRRPLLVIRTLITVKNLCVPIIEAPTQMRNGMRSIRWMRPRNGTTRERSAGYRERKRVTR